ncbi:hypothetical protein [Nannocystis punicea]|uniref:PEGA domain-containing protein n=1 Tax=Nannocystis punicea TaxID=2995304 RepID=A0ABY7HKD7_9BACT|nr:hypothetical protein [Nannocystis poenicansa]WAS99324.1 hypothetical protein O0S08_24615 [Nannocystis poenicansa]
MALELRAPRQIESAVTVTLSYRGTYASDLRPDLTIAVPPEGRATLALDSGVWQLRIDDPRFESVAQDVRVEANGAGAQVLELRPRQDARTLRRFTLAWSGVGAVGVVVGASLLGVGQGRWSTNLAGPIERCQAGDPLYSVQACEAAVASAGTLRTAGAAVLGVGTGSLVGGLVARVAEPRQRRVGWIVTASLGGLMSIGGAVALGLGAQRFDRATDGMAWTNDERRNIGQIGVTHTVGGAFLGLGGGLLASSVTGLLLDRGGRFLVAAGPQVRLGGASLVLEGRF